MLHFQLTNTDQQGVYWTKVLLYNILADRTIFTNI